MRAVRRAQQKAQQCLPKSPRLYADGQLAARQHPSNAFGGATVARQIRSCDNAMGEPLPLLVLDTNAVLDWLVFDDAAMRPLAADILAGRLRWIATPEMQRELRHVVHGGRFARWRPDLCELDAAWARHCKLVPVPPAPAVLLRCRDIDDQMFVDLSLAVGARWLVSRDRALLDLGRRLRAAGVQALPPARWTALAPTD
ncbi:MAG: PIN domain-containing protein [Caldimonas sp.]